MLLVPICALKDPLRCTQTPWVISVLGAAQGHLALERGSIWLHGSSWVPCSGRDQEPVPVQAAVCSPAAVAGSNPYLLPALALWEHCSGQRCSVISAFSDGCHCLLSQGR